MKEWNLRNFTVPIPSKISKWDKSKKIHRRERPNRLYWNRIYFSTRRTIHQPLTINTWTPLAISACDNDPLDCKSTFDSDLILEYILVTNSTLLILVTTGKSNAPASWKKHYHYEASLKKKNKPRSKANHRSHVAIYHSPVIFAGWKKKSRVSPSSIERQYVDIL